MSQIALRFFGGYFRERRAEFDWLRASLLKANLYTSLEQYLSNATLSSFLGAWLFAFIFVLASRFLFGHFLVWGVIVRLPHLQLGDIALFFAELMLVILLVAIPFLGMFLLFIIHPGVTAWERRKKIDGNLPYAIGWMASMASVGIIPFIVFKKLAEAEEYYHEVSREAQRIVRDVELLGFDLITALKNLIDVTPSPRMRVFLQGAITASLSGGEMGEYFISKAKENMEENRKRFGDFINTLGMIAEVYVVALVAGPLFIIILFSAMLMMSGGSPQMLMAVIYVIVPLGSILFIFLIDSLTPSGLK